MEDLNLTNNRGCEACKNGLHSGDLVWLDDRTYITIQDDDSNFCPKCGRCLRDEQDIQPVTVPAFLVNHYNQLQLENVALKAQLTWHPVSEKPEKDGWYLLTRKDANGEVFEDADEFKSGK